MRIGIDASLASLSGSGTGRYAALLIHHLLALDGENEYVLYFRSGDRDANPLWDVRGPRVSARVTDAPLTLMRVHLNLPARLRADRVDLYHSLGFFLPWLWRGKTVVTIFDIHPVLLSDHWRAAGEPVSYWALRLHIPLALSQARWIVTLSAYARDTIAARFEVPAERIVVAPPGVDPFFAEPPSASDLDAADRRLGDGRFFLYVGALAPHKNVAGLLRAFADVHRKRGVRLVVVGKPIGRYRERVLEPLIRELGLEAGVVLTGFIDDGLLRCLYRRAVALILPSFGEGFGLPVLEAMACGTPVIASAGSALREVAGDVALYVDPGETAQIAGAMARMLDDDALRHDLSARGPVRAASFTWDRSVSAILQIYRDG